MTYVDARDRQRQLEAAVREMGAKLETFPRNAVGLTLDSAKTADWHALRAESAAAFAELRRFNEWLIKRFAAEIRAERRAKR